jgi:flagellar hook-basal body complex protein FliE
MTELPANLIAGAYATAQRYAAPVRDMAASEGGPETGAFADLVKQAVGTVVAKGDAADAEMMKNATGRADMVDVVTAVAESESALETLVAVRDRVIAAYEEIIRMPI